MNINYFHMKMLDTLGETGSKCRLSIILRDRVTENSCIINNIQNRLCMKRKDSQRHQLCHHFVCKLHHNSSVPVKALQLLSLNREIWTQQMWTGICWMNPLFCSTPSITLTVLICHNDGQPLEFSIISHQVTKVCHQWKIQLNLWL